MRSAAAWSTRYPILVLAMAVTAVLAGAVLLPRAAIDALPEFGAPSVEVQTEALGLSAEEVEQLVTVPLESKLLNGVAFLESIESQSVQGLSSILMTFEPGTDPIRARQMVAERLTQAHALPNVSKPPTMLQPLSSSNRLMMVSLSSDELSLIELSVLARWTIEPRLMGVAGVANVAIWGQRERQLQVLVDPQRLRAANVTLDEVIATTGNALWVSPLTYLEASTPGTGGFIDTPNQRLNVQHVFPIDTADDLGRVVIESADPEAARLRLTDVADVIEDHQPLIGDAVVDEGPGLLLVVEKFPEANTVEVTAAVEEALEAMAPGLAGVDIDTTVYRPASFLDSAIRNVGLATLIAFILLALVITALFLDWRAALISLVCIPVSLIAAAVVLHLGGTTFNTMTVAGLIAAIALVVDDAVVGAHTIFRRIRLDEPGSIAQRLGAIVEAVTEGRVPMVYASLAVLLATVPLFIIGGVTGALLPSALAAYLLAVAVAMLVSLALSPALAALLVTHASLDRREPLLARRLQSLYARGLARSFKHARSTFVLVGMVATLVAAAFVVGLAPRLAGSAVPRLEERDILVDFTGAPGTSHAEMSRIVTAASRELGAVDGVRRVGAHFGRAIVSDRVVGINAGQIWVSLAPEADYDATLASINSVVDGYPGLARGVSTHHRQRIEALLRPGMHDITVRLYGSDVDSLRRNAAQLEDALATVGGISSVTVESQVDEPTIDVTVDLAAAAAHGLRPGDVRRAAATLLSGIEVGSLFEDQKVFEVVVWGTPEHRQSLSDVEDLPIETPTGTLVALGEIADVRIASAPTVLRRDGVHDTIEVGANVEGRDLGSVLADVEAAIASINFPLESHAEVLGYSADREARQLILIAAAIGVSIAIFLLLQAALVSWRLAALVFVALPVALSGAVIVAVAIGDVDSVYASVGLLVILGLASRNAIRQVLDYRRIQHTVGAPPNADVIVRTAQAQLMPTLLGMLAAAAALAPFVALGRGPGLEVVRPIALVVLGGLCSSTLVNLFVVPAMFLGTGVRPEPEMVNLPIEHVHDRQVVGAG